MNGADAGPGGSELLRVEGLTRSFGGFTALNIDDLSLPSGELFALVGPNGSGKTTFFDIVSGFLKPSRGAVLFDGKEITHRKPYDIARSGLVRTFQLTRVFSQMSVIENMLAADGGRHHQLVRSLGTWNRARQMQSEVEDEAVDLLATFGLLEMREELAGNLSGGQKKLLEVARSLMSGPKLLLLDEPLAGVSAPLREQICAKLEEIVAAGTTVLFVEHDLHWVMKVASRVIVLDHGEVICDGPPAFVKNDARVVEAYLGLSGE